MLRYLLALAIFGIAISTAFAQERIIRFGYLADPSHEAALYALREGLVTSDTVRVEPTPLDIPALIQSTAARTFDVVQTAAMAVPRGNARGLDLEIVGTALRYHESGQGAGIWVRADSDIRTMDDLRGGRLAVFAEYFHTVAWDARGYGGSDDYDGPLDFSDFTHDLARVLDHFDAAKAHLAGLSMGGRIAMDFAEKYPDRLLSLTLIDTHPGFANLSEEKKTDFIRLRKEPLINGKEPKDIAGSIARDIAEQIPGAKLTIIDDAGHLVNIEQPEAFNRAALGFLLEQCRSGVAQ